MKIYLIVLLLLIVVAGFFIFQTQREGWYPSTTYVNAPGQYGVYPMAVQNDWWMPIRREYPYGGWNWWHRPRWQQRRGPIWQNIYAPPEPVWTQPAVPAALPAPAIDTWTPQAIPYTPMLTSLKGFNDYHIGQWVKAGIGIGDGKYVDVMKLNLDPSRRFFRYKVITDKGQEVPINVTGRPEAVLEDGDRFRVPGMHQEFKFQEADKYMYVYT